MTEDRTALDRAEEAIQSRVTRPELNVWTSLVPDDTLRAQAKDIDAKADVGYDLPLRGLAFAVKDNIDVADLATTAGCREFAYTPEVSSPSVAQLVDAGALVVGKTNLDQFATGLVGTRSPDFGICRNPIDPTFIAGGSSSGSAIAVATGMVDIALGTDTAGSGRVPAAACGIIGVKPTRGLISTHGVVPASRSFDCVSIFATSGFDAARALAFTTPDDVDWTPVPTRIRVGVPRTLDWFGDDEASARFDAAVATLAVTGAELVDIDLTPFTDAGRLLYGSALVAERASAFGAFAAAHPTTLDPTVLAIVKDAARHSATDVFEALAALDELRVRSRPTWREVDVIVVPTIARHPTVDQVLADPFGPNAELGTYTSFVNLLGLCAVAVPAGGRANGLPFGVSLVSPAMGEQVLLTLAADLMHEPWPAVPHRVRLAVVGAHLSGMPLNHQLLELDARLVATTTTAPAYRLFDLGTTPARPGMIRDVERGAEIAVEVWELDPAGVGTFMPKVPAPLAIGTVELADGTTVLGFLCESYALSDAQDITDHGGWRAYQTGVAE
jgi:allophanate hydrolase